MRGCAGGAGSGGFPGGAVQPGHLPAAATRSVTAAQLGQGSLQSLLRRQVLGWLSCSQASVVSKLVGALQVTRLPLQGFATSQTLHPGQWAAWNEPANATAGERAGSQLPQSLGASASAEGPPGSQASGVASSTPRNAWPPGQEPLYYVVSPQVTPQAWSCMRPARGCAGQVQRPGDSRRPGQYPRSSPLR